MKTILKTLVLALFITSCEQQKLDGEWGLMSHSIKNKDNIVIASGVALTRNDKVNGPIVITIFKDPNNWGKTLKLTSSSGNNDNTGKYSTYIKGKVHALKLNSLVVYDQNDDRYSFYELPDTNKEEFIKSKIIF